MLDRALASALPLVPRRAVRAVARRYIAGTTLTEALDCVSSLNAEGASATVDILGEYAPSPDEASRTRDAYVEVLRAMGERNLDANVSVKLTALGLQLDADRCREHVESICIEAQGIDRFVRLDMEDSSCTQATLDLYEAVRRAHDNVGPVLQAYLRRTVSDARALAKHRANVRLCKGIYQEPLALAWHDREAVRRSFVRSLEALLAGGCHVGIATHDELLVWEALRLVEDLGVAPSGYEFQMLLGVEEDLRRVLLAAGHRLRVYVPFGEAWYEYSVRRLRENPEIAGHVARATAARFFGKR